MTDIWQPQHHEAFSDENVNKAKENMDNLTRQFSKQLSEGDLLDTVKYSIYLKKHFKELQDRLKDAGEVRDAIVAQLSAAERAATSSTEEVYGTIHTDAINELLKSIDALHEDIKDAAQIRSDLVRQLITIRRRTDSKLSQMFTELLEEAAKVETRLQEAEKAIESHKGLNKGLLQKKEKLDIRLEKIKSQRGICFACVDVYPDRLYQMNGPHPSKKSSKESKKTKKR